MSWEKIFTVTSLRNTDKVWTSQEEFWADHADAVQSSNSANDAAEADGTLLSQSSVLNEGGQSVTYTKVYASEDAWREYEAANQDAIAEETTALSFEKVSSRIPEPA